MKLSLIEDWASLRQRADEWNALAARAGIEGTFASLEWCDALRKAHYKGGPAPTLIVEDSGRLVAVWPLHLDRLYLGKLVPCRRLSDHGAWHTGHNGLICGADHEAVAVSMLDYLRREFRAWDTLEVVDLIQDSASHQALLGACARLGLHVTAEPGKKSPYLSLPDSWRSYLDGCSSKFRSDLKRCNSSVTELGHTEYRRFVSPQELTEAYEHIVAIERHSWKQAAGSAITSRPWEEAFYRELRDQAGPRNLLEATILLVDGQPTAYDLGLVSGGRYACLKTSFVERARSANVGKALRRQVVESLCDRGIREHDFLGEAEPWKMQWTTTVRQHVNLTIYRRGWYADVIRGLRGVKGACTKIRLSLNGRPERGGAVAR